MTIKYLSLDRGFILVLVALFCITYPLIAQDQPLAQVILLSQLPSNGKTIYTYRVINYNSKPIVSIVIGYDAQRDAPELTLSPSGWTFEAGLSANSTTSPSGWGSRLIVGEESPFLRLEWRLDNPNFGAILPNALLDGFAVITDRSDSRYSSGHFDVRFQDSTHFSSLLGSAASRVVGDANGDGVVDCADLTFIRAAIGRRVGDPLFDPFADVNADGVIDIRDTAIVSQKLLAGTHCQ